MLDGGPPSLTRRSSRRRRSKLSQSGFWLYAITLGPAQRPNARSVDRKRRQGGQRETQRISGWKRNGGGGGVDGDSRLRARARPGELGSAAQPRTATEVSGVGY